MHICVNVNCFVLYILLYCAEEKHVRETASVSTTHVSDQMEEVITKCCAAHHFKQL